MKSTLRPLGLLTVTLLGLTSCDIPYIKATFKLSGNFYVEGQESPLIGTSVRVCAKSYIETTCNGNFEQTDCADTTIVGPNGAYRTDVVVYAYPQGWCYPEIGLKTVSFTGSIGSGNQSGTLVGILTGEDRRTTDLCYNGRGMWESNNGVACTFVRQVNFVTADSAALKSPPQYQLYPVLR